MCFRVEHIRKSVFHLLFSSLGRCRPSSCCVGHVPELPSSATFSHRCHHCSMNAVPALSAANLGLRQEQVGGGGALPTHEAWEKKRSLKNTISEFWKLHCSAPDCKCYVFHPQNMGRVEDDQHHWRSNPIKQAHTMQACSKCGFFSSSS